MKCPRCGADCFRDVFDTHPPDTVHGHECGWSEQQAMTLYATLEDRMLGRAQREMTVKKKDLDLSGAVVA